MPKRNLRVWRVASTPLGSAGTLHKMRMGNLSGKRKGAYGPLAHASFQIFGDALEPEFWTQYFGCHPTESHAKGDTRPCIGTAYDFGSWSFSSERVIKSDELDSHIAFLVERLRLPRPQLRDLLRKKGQRSRVFCFWANDSGNRVPRVRRELLEIVKQSGTAFEIDEYPLEITVLDGKRSYKAWL